MLPRLVAVRNRLQLLHLMRANACSAWGVAGADLAVDARARLNGNGAAQALNAVSMERARALKRIALGPAAVLRATCR